MPSAVTTHLYLVRHGETDWNREQRLQGTRDVPLNSGGVAQARRLADAFGSIPIASIVTSPLARASATAGILARACACPVTIDPRLREIDHGAWSGRTLPDIGRRFPWLVQDGRLLRQAFEVSGGEQLREVYRRGSEALADVIDAYGGQSVLVVGHGVTLAAVWCAATGVDIARLDEYLPPNAGGVVLTFTRRQLVDARKMAISDTRMTFQGVIDLPETRDPLSVCGGCPELAPVTLFGNQAMHKEVQRIVAADESAAAPALGLSIARQPDLALPSEAW